MKRVAVLALSAAISALGACTTLVGVGPEPVVLEGSAGGAAAASEAGSGVDGGAGSVTPANAGAAGGSGGTRNEQPVIDGGAAGAETDPHLMNGTPKLLALGASPFIAGVTTDGWVLFKDRPAQDTYAASLSGGEPVLVAPAPAGAFSLASVQRNVGFVYIGKQLTVWTRASGPQTVTCDSFATAVSADGRRVVYQAPASGEGGAPNRFRFIEADVDLTHPTTLSASDSNGIGNLRIMDTTRDRFVFTTVTALSGSKDTYSGDSFTNAGVKTHLFDNAASRVAGEQVLSYDAQDNMLIRSASGGPIVTIAAPAAGLAGTGAELTPDGSRIVFVDNSGQFWSSPTASASPSWLPDMPAPGSLVSLNFSPDGSQFFYRSQDDGVWIASTTAGKAVSVRAVETGRITRLQFSSDSRYLFFRQGTDLEVARVDTGDAVRVAANVACENEQYDCALPGGGAKIIYLSGGDLWSADAGDVPSAMRLARSVMQFVLGPDKATAVYRFKDSSTPDRSGVYSVALP